MFFSITKKKIIYSLLAVIPILIIGIILVAYTGNLSGKDNLDQDIQQVNNNIEMIIEFQSHYVVGDDYLETKTEFVESIEEIKNKYYDWEVIDVIGNKTILYKEVEDISPECKSGSYFSLDPQGYLTLFSGNPTSNSEQNSIIETFFRIDIEKLESSLPNEPVRQLYQGIPIQDLAEYNSVLSTFSEFSIE